MTKLVLLVDWVLKRSLMLLMAAIVLVVCWQVLSRFVLANPSSMTEEIARCLLLVDCHVRCSLCLSHWSAFGPGYRRPAGCPPLWQHRIAFVLTAAVVVFSSIVMVWGGGELVWLHF